MAILAPSTTQNNRGGNGKYVPLRHRANQKRAQEDPNYLDKKDSRMRFKNSKDPVFVAFEYLDKQPLSKLAVDFVKDSLHDIMYFVSKVK